MFLGRESQNHTMKMVKRSMHVQNAHQQYLNKAKKNGERYVFFFTKILLDGIKILEKNLAKTILHNWIL